MDTTPASTIETIEWLTRVVRRDDRDGGLPPGEMAELRRPGEMTPALWRLLTHQVVAKAVLDLGAADPTAAESAFGILIQALAENAGSDTASIGAALALTGFSEARTIRLLRARGPGEIGQAARDAVRWCAGKGRRVHFLDRNGRYGFALFILRAALWHDEAAERQSHAIARDYFGNLEGAKPAANTNEETVP